MPTSIFINYRQDDSEELAEYIRLALAGWLGEDRVFLDKESIEYGEVIDDKIWEMLDQVEAVLVIMGTKWHTIENEDGRRLTYPKDWVRSEIERAHELEKLIIPILYNQTNFNEVSKWLEKMVPSLAFLASQKYFPIHKKTLNADAQALINFLSETLDLPERMDHNPTDLPSPPSPAEQLENSYPLPQKKYSIPQSKSPFMGLKYFQRVDTRLFFGRTAETLRLCRAIDRFPLVLLYGQSGVGKSSILNAGLLPRLEAKYHCHYVRRLKLHEDSGEEYGLHRQLEQFMTDQLHADHPTLLILDQVEEMYTNPIAQQRSETETLGQLLAKLITQYPNCKVLLAFRSEHFAPIRKLITQQGFKLIEEQDIFLQALDINGLREAIEGVCRDPALKSHYRLEISEELVEKMCKDLLQDGRPESHVGPLLQYQLRNLWDKSYDHKPSDHAWIHLDLKSYQAQYKHSLSELIDEQIDRLQQIEPLWKEYVQNGFIWDLLYGYTTHLLTATLQEDQDLATRYAHIEHFERLFSAFKHHCYLMIPVGTEQRPATRLAHDTFAPLIREQYQESDAPSQRAWRIIDTKLRERKAGIRPVFSETDIQHIAEGKWGMQAIPKDLQTIIDDDAKRYQQQQKDRFQLAFQAAREDYEHLRFTQALDNLLIAYREGIYPEQIATVVQDLPWPLRYLEEAEALQQCQALITALASHITPDSELGTSMHQRFFPHMIAIKGGSYTMGSEEGAKYFAQEGPEHPVTVDGFWMGDTPITCWQYGLYCKKTGKALPRDSGFGRGDKPVVNVNWYEAREYCNWLSEREGLEPVYEGEEGRTVHWERNGYRLPTEAEWEFAARERDQKIRFGNGKDIARTTEMNFDGTHAYNRLNDEIASWHEPGEMRGETTPVHAFQPNELGLYDMSGNVFEWCEDGYDEKYYASSPEENPRGPESKQTYQVVRGGSWYATLLNCRVSYRYRDTPIAQANNVGFRVVRRLT